MVIACSARLRAIRLRAVESSDLQTKRTSALSRGPYGGTIDSWTAVLRSRLKCPSNQRGACHGPILTPPVRKMSKALYAHERGMDGTTPAQTKAVRVYQRTPILRRLRCGSNRENVGTQRTSCSGSSENVSFPSNLLATTCRNLSKYSPDRALSRVAVLAWSQGLELSRGRVIVSAVLPPVPPVRATSNPICRGYRG